MIWELWELVILSIGPYMSIWYGNLWPILMGCVWKWELPSCRIAIPELPGGYEFLPMIRRQKCHQLFLPRQSSDNFRNIFMSLGDGTSLSRNDTIWLFNIAMEHHHAINRQTI
jgi:hypothetical protein